MAHKSKSQILSDIHRRAGIFRLVGLFLWLLTWNACLHSQNHMDTSALEFHQYVLGQKQAARESGRFPQELIRNLEARMSAHRATFDASKLEVVRTLRYQEDVPGGKFVETQRIIRLLIDQDGATPWLKAQLNSIQAAISEGQENRPFAAQLRGEVVDSLTELKNEVDLLWIQNQVQAGYNHLYLDQEAEAEPYFLDVLSFPFTLVEDVDYFRSFRELYIEAGKGLIDCRKNDLAALNDIFFIPAMDEELQPHLKKAKELAAKGK